MKFLCTIKTFTRKDKSQFQKVTALGVSLPFKLGALPEEYYTIKNVLEKGKWYEDGFYIIECENAWIDQRFQYIDKKIVRIQNLIEIKRFKR